MRILLYSLVVSCISISAMQAGGNFSFEGTFLADDDVQLFDFTLLTDSTVTFHSYGYAGGTNAASNTISPGGFDGLLTWFGSDGSQIGSQDDGGCGNVNSFHGVCPDPFFSGSLTAGTYTLALTQSPNGPAGTLSDRFVLQGQSNFWGCGTFCDGFGNQDNGNWAVDILNVNSAAAVSATPEPATLLLAGCGVALLGLARRRRAS